MAKIQLKQNVNIEKHRNNYRIRKQIKGQKMTFTFDHYPSDKEINEVISNAYASVSNFKAGRGTFETYAKEYLSIKTNVLSESTLRGYENHLNQLSKEFKKLQLNEITKADVQKEMNDLAKKYAGKTVHNIHGFVSPVMKQFRPDIRLQTTLPKVIDPETYIPTDDEVKALLDGAKGKTYELALWLGVYALRESEVCGLRDTDLYKNDNGDDFIHIQRAKVKGRKGYIIQDFNKTENSNRRIYVSPYIAQLLREQKVGFGGYPQNILEYQKALERKLGLNEFTFQSLRHYYASHAHTIHIPDEYIMLNGGWKTDYVMKRHYRQAQIDKATDMMKKASI